MDSPAVLIGLERSALIDRNTKKSVRHAIASDTLPNRTSKPAELQTKLDNAAKKMFKK
jgi:hypothetical protein